MSRADRLLRALRGEPVDTTPIWIMRQAGRYLPEYRATRARAGDFLTLCKTPELACEVTVQPVRRLGVDAAILYSDIVVPVAAIGFGVEVVSGVGPVIDEPFRTKEDLRQRFQEALDEGNLTYERLVDFLDSVAPWGKQHVFLY